MTETVATRFIDDPHAPEVFARGASGFVVGDGFITITFESPRVDHTTSPGPVNRVVVGRLVMPTAGAQALVLSLNAFLEEHGLSPSQAASGGQMAN